MGSCVTRLQKEMETPMHNSHKTQRDQSMDQMRIERLQQLRAAGIKLKVVGDGATLQRFETPSGIPGLTYDHAGRPVWREENAVKGSTEHREHI